MARTAFDFFDLADIQAALGYHEWRIYGALGARKTGDISTGRRWTMRREMLDLNDPLHAELESLTPEQMLRMFPSKTVKPLSASTDENDLEASETNSSRVPQFKHQNAEYRRLSRKT